MSEEGGVASVSDEPQSEGVVVNVNDMPLSEGGVDNANNKPCDPAVGMEFEDDEQAFEFYNAYARRIGFSVRKQNTNKMRSGQVRSRRFVCYKEGHSRNNPTGKRATERTGCEAFMSIRLGKNGKYTVDHFVPKHNHPLVIAARTHLLRSHKYMMCLELGPDTVTDGKVWRCKLCKRRFGTSTVTGFPVANKKPLSEFKPADEVFDYHNWLLLKCLFEASIPPSLDEMLSRFSFLNPSIKFWQEEKFQEVLVEIFKSMQEEVKVSLGQFNSKMSITIDFWTSSEQFYYMSITCHWIDENWYPQKVLLDVCRIPYPCSGPKIFQVLMKVLKTYNIENRILSCTHDTSPTAIHACHLLTEELSTQKTLFCYIPCAALTLKFIIEDGLQTLKPIQSKIREFVLELNSTPEIAQDFMQTAAAYREGSWKFPLDASASWSGDFTLLDIIRKASNSMDTVIRKHEETFGSGSLMLNSTEKSALNILHSYFEPLYKVTTNLCTSKALTIGLVLFYMDHVFERVGICRDNCQHEWLKIAADDMAKRATTFSSQVYNPFTFTAAVLDPRIKKDLVPESLNTERNIEEARGHFIRNYSLSPYPCITNITSSYNAPAGEEVNGDSFAEEIARKRRHRASMSTGADELTQYLAEPPVPIATDALDWWRMNATRFPRLSIMARDYFSVQGASVEPEELFSSKGDETRKRQYCLPRDSIQPLMCIKSWLQCGYKFKYQESEIDFNKIVDFHGW